MTSNYNPYTTLHEDQQDTLNKQCIYHWYGLLIEPLVINRLLFIPASLCTARLFHQAFISFRKYVLELSSLAADLHIILSDVCCGAGLLILSQIYMCLLGLFNVCLTSFIVSQGHIDDIYPYFMRHAKQIFPMLDCLDDLRKISDLRVPVNW